jgi:hypothetical protein
MIATLKNKGHLTIEKLYDHLYSLWFGKDIYEYEARLDWYGFKGFGCGTTENKAIDRALSEVLSLCRRRYENDPRDFFPHHKEDYENAKEFIQQYTAMRGKGK